MHTPASIAALAFVCSLTAALAGCSRQPPQPDQAQLAAAEQARPADLRLSQIYQRSCISCHTSASSGAPIVGFQAAWQPRQEQGMPALLEHARAGYRAMPAKGFCNDCSDQDLQQLIEFMVQPIAAGEKT